MIRILFVCLGNICRSPTAEAVFRARAKAAGLTGVEADSAGTGDWHIGHPPDKRAAAAALERGYDLSALRARQVTSEDFHRFTHIIAMDRQNLIDLKAIAPAGHTARLELFINRSDGFSEVPDPYFGGEAGFSHALDLIEAASDALIARLKAEPSPDDYAARG